MRRLDWTFSGNSFRSMLSILSSMLHRGENFKVSELPFRKVPVLTHGSLTIAESPSILRYVGQLPGGETWYWDRDLLDRIKVDEFLDYWQSTLNPAALKYAQNKLGYKVTQ